jgi:hypothetical protein
MNVAALALILKYTEYKNPEFSQFKNSLQVMQMLRFPSFNVAMLSFCPEGLTSP